MIWTWNVRERITLATIVQKKVFDLKNIDLDTKIVILSVLVQKLWSRTPFCTMVAIVMRLGTSHIQTTQNVFLIFWTPQHKLPCVEIW